MIQRRLGVALCSTALALLAGAALDHGAIETEVEAQGYTATVCASGNGGITLSIQDHRIVLDGGLCPKDDDKFRKFLKTTDKSIRTIKLRSGGGNSGAGEAIGVLVRNGGYDTYVDGAVDRCASSCTNIFASGNHRYYSGAETITTGMAARRGLGYHYLDARHEGETDADKDRMFNATVLPFLKKMLPPPAVSAAVALMSANRTPMVTWLNGPEALRDGIATSLDIPR